MNEFFHSCGREAISSQGILGLDSTNFFKTVKFVEKDKYCQKVLRKNFPNIPIEEDIKNVKGKEGDADVIVGGFP